MTPEQAHLLLGPPPPSRTSEYSAYRYRLMRILHPERYLNNLKKKQDKHVNCSRSPR